MGTIIVDPVTRIEGHLKAEVTTDGTDATANVTNAVVSGTMARGMEALLKGKDPRDASFVTARICGVCFGAHAWTSVLAVEDANGAQLPEAARLLRNLIVGACWLHDHPLHFYQLSALDYLDLTALVGLATEDPNLIKIQELIANGDAGPLTPFEARDGFCVSDPGLVAHCVQSYLTSLGMQIKAKKMSALFGGKQPHQSGIVVGGVTELPSRSKRDLFRSMLTEQIAYMNEVYAADILLLAQGPLLPAAISQHGVGHPNFLSYGGFPEADGSFMYPAGALVNGVMVTDDRATIAAGISEDITNSKYVGGTGGHPSQTEQEFDLGGGHSFVKAPRFQGNPMEVGPLARMVVAMNTPGHPAQTHPATVILGNLVGAGVKLGTVARHGARCLETLILCDGMVRWMDELDDLLETTSHHHHTMDTVPIHDTAAWEPQANVSGCGMTEAPRGALAHWITTDGDAKIDRYACVVPSTWNASPADAGGVKGPYEESLMSLSGMASQLNVCRVIRAFDPCIACAVHLIKPDGDVEKFMLDV